MTADSRENFDYQCMCNVMNKYNFYFGTLLFHDSTEIVLVFNGDSYLSRSGIVQKNCTPPLLQTTPKVFIAILESLNDNAGHDHVRNLKNNALEEYNKMWNAFEETNYDSD